MYDEQLLKAIRTSIRKMGECWFWPTLAGATNIPLIEWEGRYYDVAYLLYEHHCTTLGPRRLTKPCCGRLNCVWMAHQEVGGELYLPELVRLNGTTWLCRSVSDAEVYQIQARSRDRLFCNCGYYERFGECWHSRTASRLERPPKLNIVRAV